MSAKPYSQLGAYLKDRRTRLDPAEFGILTKRRRTPGLRREEVAQRANISTAWYTWLEQGRGGAPSIDVLNRIANSLMLTDFEREHLFIVGLGHPPEVKYNNQPAIVTPRLQRMLDALEVSPAIIKTATWDVVAWNRPAALLLTDYNKLLPSERNILRLVFCNPDVRAAQEDWETTAHFVVGAFRADASRVGASSEVKDLADELCARSSEFAVLWAQNDVLMPVEGLKKIRHATLGLIELEYCGFSVDGRPDLGMIVYNPTSSEIGDRIRSLVLSQG